MLCLQIGGLVRPSLAQYSFKPRKLLWGSGFRVFIGRGVLTILMKQPALNYEKKFSNGWQWRWGLTHELKATINSLCPFLPQGLKTKLWCHCVLKIFGILLKIMHIRNKKHMQLNCSFKYMNSSFFLHFTYACNINLYQQGLTIPN